MARGRAAAATILYTGSAIAGIIVEANLRYLPEWTGAPVIPASLVVATSVLVLASLGAAAMLILEAARGAPETRLLLAIMGVPPLAWGFWLLTVLYYTVVEPGVPGPRVLGLGMALAYVSWLLAGPLAARLEGGLAYGVGLSLAGGLGISSLSMFLGLHLLGLEGEWSRLAGHGIILSSTGFLVAGFTLYQVYARACGGRARRG